MQRYKTLVREYGTDIFLIAILLGQTVERIVTHQGTACLWPFCLAVGLVFNMALRFGYGQQKELIEVLEERVAVQSNLIDQLTQSRDLYRERLGEDEIKVTAVAKNWLN
jgi:hypothetical protein